MIVLAFTSLILITGSPFQIASSLVENYGHLYIKNIGQEVYAEDDDDGSSNDEESDDNDVPIEEDVHTLFEDELEREDVDKYCDASEDYAKHPTECNKLYSIVEKREEDSRQYNQELQKICEDVDAEWKDGVCDTKGDDRKANQFFEKSLLIDAE
jgi:hypothetical protein